MSNRGRTYRGKGLPPGTVQQKKAKTRHRPKGTKSVVLMGFIEYYYD